MARQSLRTLLLLAALLLLPALLASCTVDPLTNTNDNPDSGNPSASEPEPAATEPDADDDSEEPGEPSDREGPDGCYLEDSHVCDCDLDEAQCEGVGIWTTGCSSCATPDTPDAGGLHPDAGGFHPDAGLIDDAGTIESAFGCYDPVTHGCDCGIAEAACTEAAGIWTDQCECASNRDAGADAAGGNF